MVLDPLGGPGTTGLVADRLDRNAILIELSPAYAEMAAARIKAACSTGEGVPQPAPSGGLFDFMESK